MSPMISRGLDWRYSLLDKGGIVSQLTQPGSHERDSSVQDATKAEEAREAAAAHTADRPPSAEEEAAAERNTLEPGVAEHEREMGRIGAEVKGEGRSTEIGGGPASRAWSGQSPSPGSQPPRIPSPSSLIPLARASAKFSSQACISSLPVSSAQRRGMAGNE